MMLNKVSLNTIGLNRIGLNRIGKPSRGSSDRPYIDPEVLASLKAVCICYGKSNDDPDRAIVKNLVDPDNPFVISNAAYTEGSGYADKGSPYYGAFVTDGIDDTIISTKTLAEMGITDEVTVVSMVHQISLNSTYNFSLTNYIENLDGSGRVRNEVFAADKTGIYGYSASLVNKTTSIINTILGDKNDYIAGASSTSVILEAAKFSVVGRASNISEVSSIAWYWTIIANKVLTTDQINQVIAYFNLDRTLKSDILCNTIKQGITNENHAEFGDKLIDFSGNGRDIQLNNIAWKGDSGIGKYETELSNTSIWTQSKETTSSPFSSSYNGLSGWIVFANTELTNSADMPSFKIQVKGLLEGQELIYRYYDSNGQSNVYSMTKDGEYTLPSDVRTAKPQISNTSGFQVVKNETNIITITQIPSHAGALCLDGVNDFGKVTGMPIYKDYTAIVCREFISDKTAPILSKAKEANNGAFAMEIIANPNLGNTALYSFGKDTPNIDIIQSKSISYQTKYIYNSKDIVPGNGIDYDTMWIGKLRDNHAWFANAAIYSLMSFPYSMSEFLIERQLKKHKLGTLYPDMVEFRPVIKANNDYEIVYTAIIKPNNWQEISVGDYVTVGESVAIQIKLNNPLEVTNVSSNSLADVSFYKEETGDNVYTIYGRLLDGKSPQKISLTIEQDENYVQFNPTINSNAIFEVGNEETMPELFTQLNNGEIDGIILYMQGDKAVLPNNWIDKNTKVRAIIYCLDTVSEEDIHFTVDGKTKYCYSAIEDGLAAFGIMDEDSQEEQYMTNVLTANTIDIQLDQYIRYEDIVQPYPLFFEFTDENGNLISWGGKAKVGSTITRTKSVADANLLAGMYNTSSYKLNGKPLEGNSYIVEKQMIFTCTATWTFDDNEPNCILSPRLLRIPNSSYKILGHIPDISGHGNHGVIHNSAYAEGSGVNEDGSYQFDGVDDFVTIPTLSSGGKQVLMKVNLPRLNEIIYDQRKETNTYTFAILTTPSQIAYDQRNSERITYIDGILNTNIIAEQLMGVTHNIVVINSKANLDNTRSPILGRDINGNNWSRMRIYDFMLFDNISTDDKIKELNEYVGIEAKVELPPYYWDNYGKTNLDEDKNYTANLGTVKDVIEVSQPAIFAENWYDYYESLVSSSPIINKTDYSIEVKPTHMDNNFMMMLSVDCDTPLPAFRAKFTRTSNVDVSYAEIRYGYYVNGKSTYIDIFGENNSAESVILDIPASEKSYISGYNVDDFPNILIEVLPADNSTRYGLSNTNFAYDKMSGFGGYEFAKFDNELDWYLTPNNGYIDVVSRNGYSITLKNLSTSDYGWYFQNSTVKGFITKDIPFKVKANKSIRVYWDMHSYKPDGENFGYVVNNITLNPNEDTSINLRHLTEEELTELEANKDRMYYLLWFDLSALAINEEVTIEMLPLYPNGLVYDGVTDYSENVNIPAFTDYTYVFKRELLGLDKNSGTASMYKGSFVPNGGRAFIADYYIKAGGATDGIYGFSFGTSIKSPTLLTDNIVYGTKTSVNGVSVSPSSPDLHKDDASLTLGKWDVNYKQMVFYKLILYPKTIPLLQINFLKNLMEKDEIIDLNNKIFIRE